jgi:hypothetical protein
MLQCKACDALASSRANEEWPLCERCESIRLGVLLRWGRRPGRDKVSVVLRHRGVFFVTPSMTMRREIDRALNDRDAKRARRRVVEIVEEYKAKDVDEPFHAEANTRILLAEARQSVKRLEVTDGEGSRRLERARRRADVIASLFRDS